MAAGYPAPAPNPCRSWCQSGPHHEQPPGHPAPLHAPPSRQPLRPATKHMYASRRKTRTAYLVYHHHHYHYRCHCHRHHHHDASQSFTKSAPNHPRNSYKYISLSKCPHFSPRPDAAEGRSLLPQPLMTPLLSHRPAEDCRHDPSESSSYIELQPLN